MATPIKSLERLAIHGVKAHAQPGEVFIGGSMGEDRLVLSFTRGAFSRYACKGVQRTRLVTCERKSLGDDGDFAWYPASEVIL